MPATTQNPTRYLKQSTLHAVPGQRVPGKALGPAMVLEVLREAGIVPKLRSPASRPRLGRRAARGGVRPAPRSPGRLPRRPLHHQAADTQGPG